MIKMMFTPIELKHKYMGIKARWSHIHKCWRFVFRLNGRQEAYGAPTKQATESLVDNLLARRNHDRR